jgi:hypothetical protein
MGIKKSPTFLPNLEPPKADAKKAYRSSILLIPSFLSRIRNMIFHENFITINLRLSILAEPIPEILHSCPLLENLACAKPQEAG